MTPEALASLYPHVAMGGSLEVASSFAEADPIELSERGWVSLAPLHPSSHVLSDAIEGLVANGLPATAIYAFDDPWLLGEGVRQRMSIVLGAPYVLVEDVWAFLVRPGRAGWRPHRGLSTVLDRRSPEYLNVWVALTDAGEDRSCMHFVPLHADPSYPSDLESVQVLESAAQAAPVRAGVALAWNANTLHWGGRCEDSAPGPRMSCTFCLCREDAVTRLRARPIDLAKLSPWARLDLIARQILIYGDDQPDVSPEIRAWAASTSALSGQMYDRKEG